MRYLLFFIIITPVIVYGQNWGMSSDSRVTDYQDMPKFNERVSLTLFSDSVCLFRTYDDFMDNKFELYTKVYFKKQLTFFQGHKWKIIKAKDMWGFIYKGILFRSSEDSESVGALAEAGHIYLYENAYIHIDQIKAIESGDSTFKVYQGAGSYCWISEDMRSSVIQVSGTRRIALKRFKNLIENNKYDDLFGCSCIHNDASIFDPDMRYNGNRFFNCARGFNKKKIKKIKKIEKSKIPEFKYR